MGKKSIDPDLVAGLTPFEGMDRADVAEVLQCANLHAFAAEETVFHEGQEAETFYLLLDGYIRVERTAEGGDQLISLFIPPGELFGIAAALGRVTYPASAVTATEVAALTWPMRLWSQIAMRHAGFASATHRTIGGRFAEMNDRLMEMATAQVQHRVARTLMRLAAQSGAGEGGVSGGAVEIAFPITRRQISEMSGTTLHTVSRLLSAWERQGIVESRRKHVAIRDPAELEALGIAS